MGLGVNRMTQLQREHVEACGRSHLQNRVYTGTCVLTRVISTSGTFAARDPNISRAIG